MSCKWFVVIEDEKYLEIDAKTNNLFGAFEILKKVHYSDKIPT